MRVLKICVFSYPIPNCNRVPYLEVLSLCTLLSIKKGKYSKTIRVLKEKKSGFAPHIITHIFQYKSSLPEIHRRVCVPDEIIHGLHPVHLDGPGDAAHRLQQRNVQPTVDSAQEPTVKVLQLEGHAAAAAAVALVPAVAAAAVRPLAGHHLDLDTAAHAVELLQGQVELEQFCAERHVTFFPVTLEVVLIEADGAEGGADVGDQAFGLLA